MSGYWGNYHARHGSTDVARGDAPFQAEARKAPTARRERTGFDRPCEGRDLGTACDRDLLVGDKVVTYIERTPRLQVWRVCLDCAAELALGEFISTGEG